MPSARRLVAASTSASMLERAIDVWPRDLGEVLKELVVVVFFSYKDDVIHMMHMNRQKLASFFMSVDCSSFNVGLEEELGTK